MKKIALTQGKFALVDDEDYKELSEHKWCLSARATSSYAIRAEYLNGERLGVVYMHRQILDPGDSHVDHRNGDGLDNRRDNLRICSQRENTYNRPGNRGVTSRFKGVSWMSSRAKWAAHIYVPVPGARRGRSTYLGLYDDESQAAAAYDRAARVAHGDFAYLNFPRAA